MVSLSPEYVNQTKQPRILGTFWAFFAMSVIMVSARLYIRARMLRNVGPDDYIIMVAMVMLTGYTVVTTVNVHLGYGSHAAVVKQNGGQSLLEEVLLINFSDFALGIMAFTTPKLAIASLLNRIMNPGKFHRVWLWVLTGLVFVASSICIIVLFTMCDPPKAMWQIHLMASGATCRPIEILVGYAIFTGAFSAFADLYLAIYPTVVLMRLRMSLQKRLALCAALGLGGVACAMAIVKCFQLPGLADKADPTYATADLVIWTSIESNIIIMASCIPTLGPLYELARGKRSWSSYQRYYYKQSSGKNHNQAQWPGRSGSFDAGRKPSGLVQKGDDLLTTTIGTVDNDSQERILENEGYPLGQIRRTDRVMVEYEVRKGEV